jgi:hypothetical protein
MKSNEDRDVFLSGRLLQWGLRPKTIPFNEPEYRELIERFIDRPTFRATVRDLADGLGLAVLEVNDRGIFLGTQQDSVFAQKPSDFRSGRSSADARLLDGLVQIAIAATIYPRQQDLDEDALEAKPPITCQEVDEGLRKLCAEFKLRAAENPDAVTDDLQQGFQEAWRVYESRPAVRTTNQGNLTLNSTQGLIRRHLQELAGHGCFVVSGQEPHEMFRPTLRYQILVKQLASTTLYRRLQALLDWHVPPHATPVDVGGAHA